MGSIRSLDQQLVLSCFLPFLLYLLSPSGQQVSGWFPGLRLLQEASLEPSWLQACLKDEHIHVPEYTDLCAYSLGWVCFGFLPLFSPWGHLVKSSVFGYGWQMDCWYGIPTELIKYTCYLLFVRKYPREWYWLLMPCFKWILRVKSRNERGIKLTAAAYFPLKCHVKCMKGPGSGVNKTDFSSSSLWSWLLHGSPSCSLCPHRGTDWRWGREMQRLLYCFSPSWCGNWTQNLALHKQTVQLQDPCSSGGCLLSTFLPWKETWDSQLGRKQLQR